MLAPPGLSSPSPLEMRRSISVASSGWLATSSRAVLLLPPAEVGDAVVVAVQDARLAGRRRRGQQRVPVAELVGAVADPAGHLRHAAGAQRVRQHVVRQAVELDDHQPGLVGVDDVRTAARERPHQRAVVRVVLAEAEQQADGARQ